MRLTDPVELLKELVRIPSVTPDDGRAIDLIGGWLSELGFDTKALSFGDDEAAVPNLHARLGTGAPHIGFNGHTDVVPAGDASAWRHDPFAGDVADGRLYGRGACDMKGGIACFIAAIAQRQTRARNSPQGSVSLLITGDEEGSGLHGTTDLMAWAAQNGQVPDICLVGEPTSALKVGDRVKVGRRGSLSGLLEIRGRQGHTAYPELADNPLHKAAAFLNDLLNAPLDQGYERFQASDIQLTSIDVGNQATNVIPATVRIAFNIRFNPHHTGASLERLLRARLEAAGLDHELTIKISGEAFLAGDGDLAALVETAIQRNLGRTPRLSTSGGTSDARFVKDYCPVIEVGAVGHTMHQIDEYAGLDELEELTKVYGAILDAYLGPA
ncbi:MAG: succinyl-diaminopimelate desuccinylase [Geminicoccaceae bacterium]